MGYRAVRGRLQESGPCRFLYSRDRWRRLHRCPRHQNFHGTVGAGGRAILGVVPFWNREFAASKRGPEVLRAIEVSRARAARGHSGCSSVLGALRFPVHRHNWNGYGFVSGARNAGYGMATYRKRSSPGSAALNSCVSGSSRRRSAFALSARSGSLARHVLHQPSSLIPVGLTSVYGRARTSHRSSENYGPDPEFGVRAPSPNYFLKSPATTIASLAGSMYLRSAASTCWGVSLAIFDSRSMSQAKVRPT